MADEIEDLSDATIAVDDTLIPNATGADPIPCGLLENVIEVPSARAWLFGIQKISDEDHDILRSGRSPLIEHFMNPDWQLRSLQSVREILTLGTAQFCQHARVSHRLRVN